MAGVDEGLNWLIFVVVECLDCCWFVVLLLVVVVVVVVVVLGFELLL